MISMLTSIVSGHQFGRWVLPLLVIACVVAVALSLVLVIVPLEELPLLQELLNALSAKASPQKAIYSPLSYLLLFAVVAGLETLVPAKQQPLISTGLVVDALWYVSRIAMSVLFLGAWGALLSNVYTRYLDFLTLQAIADWPGWVRFLCGILIVDFLRWGSHIIRHKVPWFWHFHAVHHSQQEMNLFTDARIHPGDTMITWITTFIPMMMFQNSMPVIIAWAIFTTLFTKFYHANIRLNLGWLRYIVVTPQSHRLHHSQAPEHRDTNYGTIFSVWDHLFNTQYRNYEVYPDTGISDPHFPHESSLSPIGVLRSFCLQLIYPFVAVVRSLSGR